MSRAEFTAENLTDEDVLALRALASGSTPNIADAPTVEACDIALGWADLKPCFNTHPSHDCIADQRRAGRALVASILNARAKVVQP